MDLTSLEFGGIPIYLLNIALIEFFKMLGFNKKVSGLLGIVTGLIFGTVFLCPGNLKEGIVIGLAIGLASTGLYSTSKNTIEYLTEKEDING